MKGSFRILALLTALIVSNTALNVISFSGDNSSKLFTPGEVQNSQGGPLVPPAITTVPTSPSDWAFLSDHPIGDQASWLHPTGSLEVHPLGYVVTYDSSFQIGCPKQQITIEFTATGAVFISINDNWQLIWGFPWPQVHKLQISADILNCGSNNLRIDVENAWWPSPAALIYSITQDQSTPNCSGCLNGGISQFNGVACQCKCASDPVSCDNSKLKWFVYPKCACMCAQTLICPSGTHFNLHSCTCDCPLKCCPKGQFFSKDTCSCQTSQLTSTGGNP